MLSNTIQPDDAVSHVSGTASIMYSSPSDKVNGLPAPTRYATPVQKMYTTVTNGMTAPSIRGNLVSKYGGPGMAQSKLNSSSFRQFNAQSNRSIDNLNVYGTDSKNGATMPFQRAKQA